MIPLRDNVPNRSFPIFNWALIAANVAVFIHELALGPRLEAFIYRFGLVPALWTRFYPLDTLVTSTFLHGGWLHIASNLWVLAIFGGRVEDRLGHFRYLLFYLLSGIAAGLMQVGANWGSPLPTIGASGAIAGVMGAYFVLYPGAKIMTLIPIFFFWDVIEIPAFFFLGFWFLIQIFSGTLGLGAAFGGVAWWAHIGGFLAGMVLIGRMLPKRRYRVVYRKW